MKKNNGGEKIKTLKTLNEIMDFMSLKNSDVSAPIKVDASYISLVKSGNRFLTIEKALELKDHFKNYGIDLDWKLLINEDNQKLVKKIIETGGKFENHK